VVTALALPTLSHHHNMPRKQSDTVDVPFHSILTAVTTTAISVSPNSTLSLRLSNLADNFDEYRFKSLRFRMHNGSVLPAAAAGSYGVSFEPGIVDTAPGTLGSLSEAVHSTTMSQQSTVPSDWVSVSPGVLAGMHSWYKTVPGTPEASEEIQGSLFVITGAANNINLEVRGVVQFRAAISSTNTPLERALAIRMREKKRVMSLLTDVPTASQPSRK
jgi:hypothetical protein